MSPEYTALTFVAAYIARVSCAPALPIAADEAPQAGCTTKKLGCGSPSASDGSLRHCRAPLGESF